MATQQQSSAPNYPGMERWKGKVALVTGASSGIGYETAKQLTQLGMNVVGCARNIARIEVVDSFKPDSYNRTLVYSLTKMSSCEDRFLSSEISCNYINFECMLTYLAKGF